MNEKLIEKIDNLVEKDVIEEAKGQIIGQIASKMDKLVKEFNMMNDSKFIEDAPTENKAKLKLKLKEAERALGKANGAVWDALHAWQGKVGLR